MLIKLPTVSDVKEFVKIMETNNLKGTLSHDIYRVDATSIMGVLSLDLTQALTLDLMCDVSVEQAANLFSKFSVA